MHKNKIFGPQVMASSVKWPKDTKTLACICSHMVAQFISKKYQHIFPMLQFKTKLVLTVLNFLIVQKKAFKIN